MQPDLRGRPTTIEANSTRPSQRAAGVRTALVLAVVALGSFGAISAVYSVSPRLGIGVLGLALVAFLLVAMTRRVSR
jgi:hypothetical protein